jgi:maleate cis-trans isomerase
VAASRLVARPLDSAVERLFEAKEKQVLHVWVSTKAVRRLNLASGRRILFLQPYIAQCNRSFTNLVI